MSDGQPVARLMTPVFVRLGVLVALLGVIAVGGVLLSTAAVGDLTNRLQPAASANQDLLQDLSDMQAGVRVWARSGDEIGRTEFQAARDEVPGHLEVVAAYAEDDAELRDLLERQTELADTWTEEYAVPRLGRPGGPDTYEPDTFHQGIEAFTAFRDAHAETTAELQERLDNARDDAQLRLRGTILAVLVIMLLGGLVVLRARTRLLVDVAEPLDDLERVVQRMAQSEEAARGTRAPAAGPREVRAVAAALNDLADAQERARSVESQIQQELRSLDTAKGDFVANVSHELRTPLTTISGYLELVAEEFDGKMASRHQRMLDASRRNVSRLGVLIDDLLTLSRAETRDTDMEQVDLGLVLKDAVTDVRMTAARRGIHIEIDLPRAPVLVLGDRSMLHRALLNVLTNSVKFSRDDGVVEAGLTRDAEAATVVIRDHGIGIPRSELDRLGTRFFRATNAVTSEIAGTGLGVRIVQTIIDKHAGDLLIDSVEGEGTTVTIQLPPQGTHVPTEAASEPS